MSDVEEAFNKEFGKKRFRIDDGLFYMVFSLLLALIILYMAFDWKNSINNALSSLNFSACMKMLYGKNSSPFDITGRPMISNNSLELPSELKHG